MIDGNEIEWRGLGGEDDKVRRTLDKEVKDARSRQQVAVEVVSAQELGFHTAANAPLPRMVHKQRDVRGLTPHLFPK